MIKPTNFVPTSLAVLILLSIFVLAMPGDLWAATSTWDGEGTDETCGGELGDGNNWSCAANWSGDTLPTSSDVATFDGTSIKDVTIDAGISVQGIDINSGYTGIITQASGVEVTVGSSHFDISDGTFAGGDAAININGAFTISGGIFTSTTGNMTVTGAFTVSSGTFDEATGTVTASSTASTWDVDATETFYNLTLAKANSNALTIGTGDTLVVLGDLLLTDGSVSVGTVDVRGDITQASTFDGGSGIIDMGDDAVAQTYTVQGGVAPGIRFDAAADVDDALVFDALATISHLRITSTFSGTVPLTNPTDAVLTFTAITQEAGTLDADSQASWKIHTLTISGGTFLPPQLITNHGGHSTWNINETQTFNALTIAKNNGFTATFTAGDTFIVTGTFRLQDGRMPVSGSPTAHGDVIFVSTWDGGAPVPAIGFGGSEIQTLDLSGVEGVHNGSFVIDKTGGQVNMISDLVLDGATKTLTIREGVFNTNGYNLTVAGTNVTTIVEDGGTLMFQGGETLTFNGGYPLLQSGSTVVYTGNGDSIADIYTITDVDDTYHHLTINSTDGNTDTFLLGAELTIEGDLTITSGTLDVSENNYAIDIAGNWSNSGSLTAREGTVTLSGSDQSMFGSTSFYNLTKVVSTADTLTLESSVTQLTTGTMTLEGAAGQLLSLRSSTPGTRAGLNPQASRSTRYLDVQDINNDNSVSIQCTTGCVDSSNNRLWTFSTTGGTTYKGSGFIPSIRYTGPQDGDVLGANTEMDLTWDAEAFDGALVNIYVSFDGGGSFEQIFENTENDGIEIWAIPNVTSDAVVIKVALTDLVEESAYAVSTPFAIEGISGEVGEGVDLDEVPTVPDGFELQPDSYVRAVGSPYIYYIDSEFRRHPFLSEEIYYAYNNAWGVIETVSFELLSTAELSTPMLPKPGTTLVNFDSSPKVYAVMAGDDNSTILRWIKTEEIAVEMYGQNWEDYMIKLPVTSWAKFIFGDVIDSALNIDTSLLKKRLELR